MSKVTVKVKFNDEWVKKLASEATNPATMLELHTLLARMCNPYVPYLNGPLSKTAIVSTHGVRYIQPYARYQYYGTHFKHTLDTHPLASAMWDKAMLRDKGESFDNQVAEIITRRAKVI